MDTEPTDPYGKRKIESDIQTNDYLRSFNKDFEKVENTTKKISGNTVAKDTRGGLTEMPLFNKDKIKRIKKKYPQVRYIHLGIIMITIRDLFRRGHDIPIIAVY
ncbi:hypothetical protein Gotur_008814 [Gossypium turneri]